MKFKKLLEKYKCNGCFTFKPKEDFEEKCNVPTNRAGIYLIYKIIKNSETLSYIGSSGQKINGKLKVRKSGLGGMKDRLVNGYHPKFGKIKRKKTFPEQMIKENISQIKIYWWITYDGNANKDFPTDIENNLSALYKSKFARLPEWHKQLLHCNKATMKLKEKEHFEK